MRHLKLKEKNKRVIYGVKKNYQFITSLNSNLKVKDLIDGDYILVDVWQDIESPEGDLYYKVSDKWLPLNNYIEYLYNLYRATINNQHRAYLY